MLTLSGSTPIFLHAGPADLRRGFDGLAALIDSAFSGELTGGTAFVFFNARKTHVKILHWDGDGFVIYYKRLERGTFAGAFARSGTLNRRELTLILEGVVAKRLHRRFSL